MPGRGKRVSSTAKTIIFFLLTFLILQVAEPDKQSQRTTGVDGQDSERYWLL